MDWRDPTETPRHSGTNARRVLVWLERRYNPPAMNAPGRMAFGHRIVHPEMPPPYPHPADGWYFDGNDDEYVVRAWAYADPPEQDNEGSS